MGEYTPGPWRSVGRSIFTNNLTELPVAEAGRYRKEVYANARLISAAPDLLGACDTALLALTFLLNMHPELFTGMIGGPKVCRDAIEKIDAAIARAKGTEE